MTIASAERANEWNDAGEDSFDALIRVRSFLCAVQCAACTKVMSVVSDSKASAGAASVDGSRAAALQRWTGRLKPALSASLLPELIRLTAEYLPVGCRFSRRLTARTLAIDDADEDGYGRTVSDGPRRPEDESDRFSWMAALLMRRAAQRIG
jgi:hypothetical protein